MKRLISAWALTATVSLVASAQTTPTPSQPSTPGGPVRPTPSQPERPGTPGSPSTPGTPSAPGGRDPATPRTPDQPAGLPPTTPGTPGGRDPSMTQPGRERTPSTSTNGQLRSLDWMVGTWTATVTITPSAESSPIESRGTMTNQWIIGDRFLQGKFEGEKGGREYEGMSYFGFDTTKGEFQTIWMDSNSPEIMQGTGQWDQGQNTLTIRGEYTDAKSGKRYTTRTVAHKESDQRYTWEMFATPSGGSEFRQLQIVFTKSGSGIAPSRTPGMSPGREGETGRETTPGSRSPSTAPGSGTPGGTPRTPTTPGTPSRPGGGGS
jgi:hypothetical protein